MKELIFKIKSFFRFKLMMYKVMKEARRMAKTREPWIFEPLYFGGKKNDN